MKSWFNRVWPWLFGAVLVVLGWRAGGWPGVALVAGALVFWLLLHFNRMMQVMKRAADRPKGMVPSAVMLNAKLKEGDSLLHVMALTRALGEPVGDLGGELETLRWRDPGDSVVIAVFRRGRLHTWTLQRPPEAPQPVDQALP